jgi:arylsulfatase A-like enzyme
MNNLRRLLRALSGLLLLSAVLGAAAGLARGIHTVAINDYRVQAPHFARRVLLDGAWGGTLWALAVAIVVIALIAASWFVAKLIVRDTTRALRIALSFAAFSAAVLIAAWLNRSYMPELTSPISIACNVLIVVIVAWLIRLLLRRPDPHRIGNSAVVRRLSSVPALLAMLLGIAALGGARVLAAPHAPGGAPDVVVIVIDALRPDRLGVYGYGRDTSPNLDGLARDSWVFTHAISTASWTKPAVASLLTGLNARNHGIQTGHWNVADGEVAQVSTLSRKLITLPELFGDAGYRTAAFGKNHHLVAELGFDQGFEVHDLEIIERGFADSVTAPLRRLVGARSNKGPGHAARKIHRRFLEWMPEHEPYFVYLHHIDVHWPYYPPREFRGRYGPRRTGVDFNSQQFFAANGPDRPNREERPAIDAALRDDMSDAYDECIHFVDHEIGALLEELRRRGRYDNALIIVTADHGEEFLEHGEIGHGSSVYDVLLRIPLLVKFPCPGKLCSGRRIDQEVQIVDIMPTLAATAGIPVPAGLDGRSLVDAPRDRVLFAENGDEIALRTNEFKFIYDLESSETQLYSLGNDPGEQLNLAQREQPLTVAFGDRVHQWLEETDQRGAGDGATVVANAEMLERLKALGYLK